MHAFRKFIQPPALLSFLYNGEIRSTWRMVWRWITKCKTLSAALASKMSSRWLGAHQFHCLKVLLHFNYLKVWWPGSELQGAQETPHPQWRRHYFYCQCLRRMRKSRELGEHQEKKPGNKMGEFGSHWISVTLKSFGFSSPLPLSFSLVQEGGSSGSAARGRIPVGLKKEPYFSSLLVFSSAPLEKWNSYSDIWTK